MGYRDYDPETARFTAKDPLGPLGGCSDLYDYCLDDPINLVDPEGLASKKYAGPDSAENQKYEIGSLEYDNSNDAMDVYDTDGVVRKRIPATSGRPGETNSSKPDTGSIPPGLYQIDPSEISEGGIMRNILGDWGSHRAPLHPDATTDTKGRDGFFIHGGKKPGSKGCIDVGQQDKNLFPELQKNKNKIWIKVK